MPDLNEPISDVVDFVGRFLDDAVGGGPRALEEYLERYPAHRAAVAQEYERLLAETGTRAPRPCADVPAPDRLGPYTLLRRLGSGGQGVVYLALDGRLGRRVALKALHATLGFVSESSRQRFRREAEVISRLEHPGLCAVYEADLDGSTPYIAMRYVAGQPLSAHIAAVRRSRSGGDAHADGAHGPCAPTSTATLHVVLREFEQLARALHAAHEASVVHRDIKPGNVMVTPEGRMVLLDFGLARSVGAEPDHLTRSGEVFGTPGYMSPEQLDPRGRVLDRRSDVYSLGVTLYEALTLERPFQGATLDVQRRAVLGDPVPDPRRHNPRLPAELRTVLETALERDLGRRYATAYELAEELRRIRAHEPVHARAPSAFYRLVKFVERHRVPVAAAVAIIVALAAGLVLAAYGLVEARRAEARLQRRNDAYLTMLAAQAVEEGRLGDARRFLAQAGGDGDAFERKLIRQALAPEDRGRCTVVARGLAGEVRDFSVSPDGSRSLIRRDDDLSLVELATGVESRVEGAFADTASTPHAWFADSRRLALRATGSIGVLDSENGAWSWQVPTDWWPIRMALSPDERALAFSSDFDPEIRVYDARDGALLATGRADRSGSVLAFSRGGDEIVAASQASMWSWRWRDPAARPEEIRTLAHTGTPGAARFGERWVVAHWGGTIYRVLDERGELVSAGPLEGAQLSLSPDGRFVVFDTGSGVRVCDAGLGTVLGTLAHESFTGAVRFVFGPKDELYTLSPNGLLLRWDLHAEPAMPRLGLGIASLRGTGWQTAFGRDLFVTTRHGGFMLWDAPTCTEVLSGNSSITRALSAQALSPDDRWIALGGEHDRFSWQGGKTRHRIASVDVASGDERWSSDLGEQVRSLAFSPDARWLAACTDGESGRSIVFDASDGSLVWETPEERTGDHTVIAWGRDGSRLAVAAERSEGASLEVLETGSWTPVWEREVVAPAVALAWDPARDALAWAGADDAIRFWSGEAGEPLGELPGLGAAVAALAFHPREPRLAAAVGSTVLLVDTTSSGEPVELASFDVGTPIRALAILDEGRVLYAATGTELRLFEIGGAPDVARERERRRRVRSVATALLVDHLSLDEAAEAADRLELSPAERAEVLAVAALHENPEDLNVEAWTRYASRAGQPAEAYSRGIAWCQRAIELVSTRGRYWNTLGRLYLWAGDYGAAVACLSRADEINHDDDPETVGLTPGSNPFDLLLRAQAHACLGQLDAARADYESGMSLVEGGVFERRISELRALARDARETLGLAIP